MEYCMSKPIDPAHQSALNELEEKFRIWRNTRRTIKDKMPQDLFLEAVELAKLTSILTVSRQLKINYQKLKNHINPKKINYSKENNFVEVSPPPQNINNHDLDIIEFENKVGLKMRVHSFFIKNNLELVNNFLKLNP